MWHEEESGAAGGAETAQISGGEEFPAHPSKEPAFFCAEKALVLLTRGQPVPATKSTGRAPSMGVGDGLSRAFWEGDDERSSHQNTAPDCPGGER